MRSAYDDERYLFNSKGFPYFENIMSSFEQHRVKIIENEYRMTALKDLPNVAWRGI